MSIIEEGGQKQVRMAYLAIVGSFNLPRLIPRQIMHIHQ
jgi:hypothetical protein